MGKKEDKVVNLQFVCPDCGDTNLYYIELLERGIPVLGIPSDGNIEFDYDKSDNADPDTIRFECANCGYCIRKEGSFPLDADWITEFDEIVAWIKKNCKQPTGKPDDTKVIKLDSGGIVVTLYGWDGTKAKRGTIISTLHEVCSCCEEIGCKMDCEQFFEALKLERIATKREEMRADAIAFNKTNFALDVLESTILAHAIAGINIESEDYIHGVDVAIDGIVNNI